MLDTATRSVAATIDINGLSPTVQIAPGPAGCNPIWPSPCYGDCGGGDVTVKEQLLKMVKIALGYADLSSCSAGDAHVDASPSTKSSRQ